MDDFLKRKPKKVIDQAVEAQKEDELLSKVSKDEPGPAIEIDEEGKEILEEKRRNDTPPKRRSPKQWFKDLSKKQKIWLIIGVIVGLAAIAGGIFMLLNKPEKKPEPVKQSAQEPEKPKTEASNLTGVQIDPELNKRPVTGIMIENSPEARPQSGLKDAGVVFEAVAEGGITRFLALYQEAQPDYIGPVRSVRPYYLDWLQGFDAPIAHAGGSADGLAKLRADGVPDLDQFANGGSYMRVDSRYAPHNLYTTMAKLDELNKSKGITSSTFESFPRKDEKASSAPTAKSMDFSLSTSLYNPHYDYDASSNSYKRSLDNRPHTDEKSGQQLTSKVVIAMVMSKGANGIYSVYNSIGNGKCFIFQDGVVSEGTWTKTSSKSQITFTDANGTTIKLNPGQTWLSMVDSSSDVSYAP